MLILDDTWMGEGLGFMSAEAARWLLVGMRADRAVFFNLRRSKFDWTRYFSGLGGVQWHLRGESATHLRRSRKPTWIKNVSHAVAQLALPGASGDVVLDCEDVDCPMVAGELLGSSLSEQRIQRVDLRGDKVRATIDEVWPFLHRVRNGLLHEISPAQSASDGCLSCALFALMQPRKALWSELASMPALASGPAALCLMIRTGYAEAQACDPAQPNATGHKPDALSIDRRYWHLPRCPGSSFHRHGITKLSWSTPPGGTRQVLIRDALDCMDGAVIGQRLRSSRRRRRPHALLLTDGPYLQSHLLERRPASHEDAAAAGRVQLIATPGVGIDPTNNFRPQQNFTGTNLRKVAADFWLQGFCQCSLVLIPSAFYNAAVMRGGRGAFVPREGGAPMKCGKLMPPCDELWNTNN